jgi:hypothetical protein
MSVADGQARFQENNLEFANHVLTQIDEKIERVRSSAKVEPCPVPTEHEHNARQILNLAKDPYFLDPVFLSLSTKRLMLTEDKNLGGLAKGMFNCDSAWLQTVFGVAFDLSEIDRTAYGEFCAKLAARRHGFVSFDALTLHGLIDRSSCLFQAAIEFVGGLGADLFSHMNLVRSFMNLIFADQSPTLGQQAAVSRLLERFVRVNGATPTSPTALLVATALNSAIREYLVKWCVGHFLMPSREEWDAARQYAAIELEKTVLSTVHARDFRVSVSLQTIVANMKFS